MTPLLLIGLLATVATAAPISLTSCLSSASVPVLLIGTDAFKQQTSPYNLRLTPTAPHVVALPSTLAQVKSAMKCASKTNTKVSVKSGGHSYGAYALSGTLVMDLQELQTVSYSPSSKLVTVGGGVRLGNLATKLYAAAQRGMPHGTCPGVGIGGHATLGGFGLDSRLWGLSTDMISSATAVLANGTAVTASATKNKDIYYALRGAGPGFAVVTEFKMKTFAAPKQNTHFTYTWTIGSAATAAKAFKVAQDWGLKSAPNKLGYGILMFPGNQFVVRGVYYGPESAFNTVIASFLTKMKSATAGIAPSVDVRVLDWIASLTLLAGSSLTTPVAGYNVHDTFYANSIATKEAAPLSQTAINGLFNYLYNTAPPPGAQWFIITNLYGGPGSKINSVLPNTNPAATSSYGDRDGGYVFQFYGFTPAGSWNPSVISYVQGMTTSLGSEAANLMGYAPYADTQLTRAQAQKRYWGGGVTRLKAIKKEVDPKGILLNPQGF